jgi:hypothetical protein
MRARCAAPLFLISLILPPLPARAADLPSPARAPSPPPRAVRLDYVRGPGAERCPGEQAFKDAVGAKVARDFFATIPKPSALLMVRLGRRGAGYEGAAELRDATGAVTWSMVFPGPTHPPAATCTSLIAALAFGLAVEVDPVELPSVERSPPPVVPPPIATPPPAKPEAPTRPFRIGASPWVDFATAPRVAVGLSLDLGFRVAWFSLDLEGRWDPPAAAIIHGAEVGTSRFVGALVPCGHVWYLAGCLLAEVDSHRGTVSGAAIPESTYAAVYATVGARLSAEIEIAPHLALRPAVDLLAALQRPALYVQGVSRWEAPAVSGRVGLGLLASF